MSLRHALLGLLREGPASGYDLMQVFNLSLNNTWPATQSQVYTELGKLAEAGLLTVSAEGPRGRKEYTLTNSGLAELRHWLLEVEPDLYPRSEGLLRIFLLGALSHDEARDYFTWLEGRSAETTASLVALDESIDWTRGDDDLPVYGRMALEYGKRLWEMTQEWAAWAREQVPDDES